MRNLSTTNLNLLKNTELIALNQDTLYQQAYLACKVNDCYVVVKDIEIANSTKRAFAIYNPNDASKTVTLNFKDIDLADTVALRDLYQKKDIGKYVDSYQVTIPQHGTKIYMAEANKRLERTRYEAETGYSNAYSEITGNVCQYSEAENCSAGYKAGWLGNSEENDLQWRNVYSLKGGRYALTIGYVCGENRNVVLYVNGKRVNSYALNSGSWDKVGKKKVAITLEPGNNVIRLMNASGWMPDVDYIEVTPVSTSSIEETEEPKVITAKKQGLYDLQGRKAKAGCVHGIVVSDNRKVFVK